MARSDASLPLIHRSAWKAYSANFAQTAFSEVGYTLATYMQQQRSLI
jgi:hypothetical protein